MPMDIKGARLPGAYCDADFRAVLPCCPVRGRLGVAFECKSDVLRLAVTPESAQALVDALTGYLLTVQSGKSADTPQVPGSMPQIVAIDTVTEVLRRLAADLAEGSLQVGERTINFEKLAPDLCEIESLPTQRAIAGLHFKPSRRLLDLAVATRAGDLNGFFVEHPEYLASAKSA